MTGAASTSWPMKAPIPRSARKAALHKLTEAGLVELDGDRYRMASEMHAEETAVRAALAAEVEPPMSDPLQLPETAGDCPEVPERSTAFLVGIIFGLLIAAVVLVVVAR